MGLPSPRGCEWVHYNSEYYRGYSCYRPLAGVSGYKIDYYPLCFPVCYRPLAGVSGYKHTCDDGSRRTGLPSPRGCEWVPAMLCGMSGIENCCRPLAGVSGYRGRNGTIQPTPSLPSPRGCEWVLTTIATQTRHLMLPSPRGCEWVHSIYLLSDRKTSVAVPSRV